MSRLDSSVERQAEDLPKTKSTDGMLREACKSSSENARQKGRPQGSASGRFFHKSGKGGMHIVAGCGRASQPVRINVAAQHRSRYNSTLTSDSPENLTDDERKARRGRNVQNNG